MSDTPRPTRAPLAAAVTLLDRAVRECAARGDTATSDASSTFSPDDLTIWHLDANLVRIAAHTLRSATPDPLPELPERPAFEPTTGLDPLELLLAARDELWDATTNPDDPDDVESLPLFLGWIRLSTALFAVRSHYE